MAFGFAKLATSLAGVASKVLTRGKGVGGRFGALELQPEVKGAMGGKGWAAAAAEKPRAAVTSNKPKPTINPVGEQLDPGGLSRNLGDEPLMPKFRVGSAVNGGSRATNYNPANTPSAQAAARRSATPDRTTSVRSAQSSPATSEATRTESARAAEQRAEAAVREEIAAGRVNPDGATRSRAQVEHAEELIAAHGGMGGMSKAALAMMAVPAVLPMAMSLPMMMGAGGGVGMGKPMSQEEAEKKAAEMTGQTQQAASGEGGGQAEGQAAGAAPTGKA